MGALFAELARHDTPGGTITLRRRRDVGRDRDVYEVKLGDEFLMSSMFTVGEEELARIGLGLLDTREDLDVVVGGLGLGYTARAVLEDPRTASVLVVEAVAPVIGWHEHDLLPDVAGLADDPRVRLVHGDFFAMAAGDDGFDPARPGRRVDAILVDIDHTPRHLLHPDHAGFYTPTGVAAVRRWLRPGGVFALWSDDPPDRDFLATLATAFDEVDAHVVAFRNVLTGGEATNTIHVARHLPDLTSRA
jgi:spermidine synthase